MSHLALLPIKGIHQTKFSLANCTLLVYDDRDYLKDPYHMVSFLINRR